MATPITNWIDLTKKIKRLTECFITNTSFAITLNEKLDTTLWCTREHEIYIRSGYNEVQARLTILKNVSYDSIYTIAKTLTKEKNNDQNKNN